MLQRYFITFRTYGTWLHGDERRSVDRKHNELGTAFLPPDAVREGDEQRKMKHPAVTLDSDRRAVVDRTIRAVCEYRHWEIHALNVRTTHVHVVVGADIDPEPIMNQFKSWCSPPPGGGRPDHARRRDVGEARQHALADHA